MIKVTKQSNAKNVNVNKTHNL